MTSNSFYDDIKKHTNYIVGIKKIKLHNSNDYATVRVTGSDHNVKSYGDYIKDINISTGKKNQRYIEKKSSNARDKKISHKKDVWNSTFDKLCSQYRSKLDDLSDAELLNMDDISSEIKNELLNNIEYISSKTDNIKDENFNLSEDLYIEVIPPKDTNYTHVEITIIEPIIKKVSLPVFSTSRSATKTHSISGNKYYDIAGKYNNASASLKTDSGDPDLYLQKETSSWVTDDYSTRGAGENEYVAGESERKRRWRFKVKAYNGITCSYTITYSEY